MTTAVTCPHCGKAIEVQQALVAHIQEELSHKHSEEIARAVRQAREQAKKDLSLQATTELTELKKQLEDQEKKMQEFAQSELQLRREKRQLEERGKTLELEVARKIDEERKTIEDNAMRKAAEEHRLRDLEYEKKIQDMKHALEDAQRKANQGSQQLQGEVQELDLEQMLRSLFPTDKIEAVGKGVRGADVRQVVFSQGGRPCGVILWESKRTKAWSDDWLQKLKSDLRAEKANIPVIVTSVMPRDTASPIIERAGVWITTYVMLEPLATLLRKDLIDVAREKYVHANKEEQADKLYEFVTSHAFRQQVEVLVEVYYEMSQQLIKERSAFERIWKRREEQIRRIMSSTVNIYGSIQGRVSSMPTVKGLELDGEVAGAESELPLIE